MGRRTKQTFCQRKQTDCKQAHEKKLNIATREMQVKTTLRYHFTQARRAIIKKSLQNNTGQKGHHQKKVYKITNAAEDVEKREPSNIVGGNINWCSHYGKLHGGLSKKLKLELPYYSAIPLLGMYPDKTIIQKKHVLLCSQQHYSQ